MTALTTSEIKKITMDQMQKAFPRKTFTVNWGSLRGQGKRCKGVIKGGMRDSTLQGHKSYSDYKTWFGLGEEEGIEVGSLSSWDLNFYWQARTSGLDHDGAMLAVYDYQEGK